MHRAFVGRDGLQVGWRLLLFISILVALVISATAIAHLLNHGHRHPHQMTFSSGAVLLNEIVTFLLVLIASWIMAKIEGRKIADYGLPIRRAFCGQFWQGIAIGFASITALLVALRLAGVFYFGSLALHGVKIWEYAVVWGLAFLFVGFFEEFCFRGYALFTLTAGIGFWPSALILSFLFGYIHHSNSGENWVGSFTAGAIGLVFCLILRRTGDLWMPIGFHAAWDWGETYFYGVPDSGQVAAGHLLNPTISGKAWLTGGTVGPEGSWFCVFLIVILWIVFAVWLRKTKYPDPSAFREVR